MTNAAPWPSLEFATWAPTKRSLHLYSQMLGKLRLALAPAQPNWMFTSLALTPRGFTTGAMPYGSASVSASVDVFVAVMLLETSDGKRRSISLAEPRTVAGVFAGLKSALAELTIDVALSPVPQEVPDQTPFDVDERPAAFKPDDARRWLAVVTAISGAFERWRARFFGRSGIQLWWGAFDFALLLFSGEHVEAPRDRGFLLEYDLDAQMLNVGFYPGDAANAAIFYGYIYPQPPACEEIPIALDGAEWSTALKEWILPYGAVGNAADPEATLTAFLDAVYRIAGEAGGWDLARFTYRAPPVRRGRRPERPGL